MHTAMTDDLDAALRKLPDLVSEVHTALQKGVEAAPKIKHIIILEEAVLEAKSESGLIVLAKKAVTRTQKTDHIGKGRENKILQNLTKAKLTIELAIGYADELKNLNPKEE